MAGFGEFSDQGVVFAKLRNEYSGLRKFRPFSVLYGLISLSFLVFGLNGFFYWTRSYVRDGLKIGKLGPFDVVIANDFETVALARRIGGPNARIILDAHEYTPDEYSKSWWYRLLQNYRSNFLVKKQVRWVSKAFTVSPEIAKSYEEHFGVPKMDLLLNVPNHEELRPSTLEPRKIRLVHHGIASRARKLELTIEALKLLDSRFTLTFMLMPTEPDYLRELKQLADGLPVEFLDPVPTSEISRTLNRFDIGIFLHPADNFNAKYCLPNKLFEFIQARLGVVVGPSPEMAKIVRDNELGLVAQDFTAHAFAETLSNLDSKSVRRFKGNSSLVARKYSWEMESIKLSAVLGAVQNEL